MSHTLEVDSIQLEFGTRKILTDIYLKCETGKITGLLGRNGQGKSSLMKIIYGTLSCEKSVRFDKISQKDAYQQPELIRYLPQNNFIPKSLTLKRVFKDFEIDYAIFEGLFPEFKNKYLSSIRSFSGGEHRLIEVYIIVKSRSQFVMLDEPFTHLSLIQIEKVQGLLVQEKQNKGLLITDHMFRNVTFIADDLYILSDEKIRLTKSLNEIETLGYARL
jgi:ABC-type lipopolysaccharide export system ATPase subunit